MSVVCRKLSQLLSEVLITSFRRPVRKGIVADKADIFDAGFLAFLDLEYEIDAVVRQLDDLRIDRDVETAAAVIDLDNALHVGLDRRPRQGAARL